MDGVDHDHHGRIRRTLKERLGLKGMGCCGGPTWGFRPTTTPINVSDSEEEEQQLQQQNHHHHQLQLHLQLQLQEDQQEQISNQVSDPGCFSPAPVNSSGNSMNLAAALAAERHFRAVEGTNNLEVDPTNVDVLNNNSNSNSSSSGGGGGGNNVGLMITAPGTPMRVSLMRLLAETDGGDVEEERRAVGGGGGGGNDTVCCVCMVRKKGAAFIPCGHTFCRVCSREVWLNRGSCPLCNRSILEILDIF
ncbi:hypothetical protein Ddye_019809 [Dipteronia dyeriana]|uniref:RING-type domain-containing protein n=1 Tax=Dipteronia dyeriana TaxID=168575 RepID=A0AAD9TZJ4_9ROSI|nr:hypothetical protein Ddye_019809 [Dipteronia dyeriana]